MNWNQQLLHVITANLTIIHNFSPLWKSWKNSQV